VRNLAYFWIGRFAGVLPYFFPAALAAFLFAARGPRDRDGWLALAAVCLSALVYMALIPDNWYGGGGTLGNRYFLNLLPLALVFAPRGRERLFAGASVLVAALLLGPALLAPVEHSLHPWRPRAARAVPAVSAGALDAERPRLLLGSVAQEAAVRRSRAQPARLLAVLSGRRYVRPRGCRRPRGLLAAAGAACDAGAARSGAGGEGRRPAERRPDGDIVTLAGAASPRACRCGAANLASSC
jgi:hypothetical protein